MTGVTPATVIVVSARPGEWLEPCLASVVDHAEQVVVVDNGSADSLATRVARRVGVEVVRSEHNRGFAGGFNLGRRIARGELVAALNDDAEAAPSWLPSAAVRLADPTVGAVTPKVLLAGWWGAVVADDDTWSAPGDHRPLGRQLLSVEVDGAEVLDRTVGGGVHPLETIEWRHWRWTVGRVPFYVPLGPDGAGTVTLNGEVVATGAVCRLVNHAGSALTELGSALEIGLGAPDDGRFDTPADRFGFSGTAPVWRAETLRRLGSLASPFFAYNEDTDWCLRAQMAGLRVVYEPGGVVHHRLSATSGGATNLRTARLAQRNVVLSMVRNAPRRLAWTSLRSRLAVRPVNGVHRSLVAHLPWAVASRALLVRHRVRRPEDVWRQWAGVDLTWDTSPPGPAALRPGSPGAEPVADRT